MKKHKQERKYIGPTPLPRINNDWPFTGTLLLITGIINFKNILVKDGKIIMINTNMMNSVKSHSRPILPLYLM